MPRGRKPAATTAAKTKAPATKKPEGLFVGGLYAKEIKGELSIGTLVAVRLRPKVGEIALVLHLQGHPSEKIGLPLDKALAGEVEIEGWQYAGGGTPLAEALKKLEG